MMQIRRRSDESATAQLSLRFIPTLTEFNGIWDDPPCLRRFGGEERILSSIKTYSNIRICCCVPLTSKFRATDITCIPTPQGMMYICAVMDLCGRMILAYRIGLHRWSHRRSETLYLHKRSLVDSHPTVTKGHITLPPHPLARAKNTTFILPCPLLATLTTTQP